MFCNGDIHRALAVDAYKTLALLKNGLIRDVIKDQLDKIHHHQFDAFGHVLPTIPVYENTHVTIDIRLINTDPLNRNQLIYTHPAQMFVYPVDGNIRLTQYTLSDDGEIADNQSWIMERDIHFFGNTSATSQCYEFEPVTDAAILLVGTDKDELDDICITYDKTDLARVDVISNDIAESRIEYWMTFFSELNFASDPDLIQQLSKQAASRKFKGYLDDILGRMDGDDT